MVITNESASHYYRWAKNTYSREEQRSYDEYLDNHPDIVLLVLLGRIAHFLAASGKNKRINNDVMEALLRLVDEVRKSDNTRASQLFVRFGTMSFVIITNTKVIKIGYNRGTERFPDNPYIVRPLIRRYIGDDETRVFVEVTERVKIIRKDEISEEELYGLYKKLREIGLVWTDVERRNAGILIRDNKVYWDKKIASDTDALNLDKKRGTEELKAGDLVVLDADYIFDENDPNIGKNITSPLAEPFENRYQKEKKLKRSNKSFS